MHSVAKATFLGDGVNVNRRHAQDNIPAWRLPILTRALFIFSTVSLLGSYDGRIC